MAAKELAAVIARLHLEVVEAIQPIHDQALGCSDPDLVLALLKDAEDKARDVVTSYEKRGELPPGFLLIDSGMRPQGVYLNLLRNVASYPIDADEYEANFGVVPTHDDVARVNCTEHGTPGHERCGICPMCGRPRFLCAMCNARVIPVTVVHPLRMVPPEPSDPKTWN